MTRDEHFTVLGPKRILALDGGGLRGILSLGFLAQIETLLRERHGGNAGFRLAHYFDLIAGTSTGAIIAAALAEGLTVDEIAAHYLNIGTEVFRRDWFRKGIVRARYDEKALIKHLQKVLGKSTTMGGPELKTGVLIVTKRVDTGSPWPLGNNPAGRFFRAKTADAWISNADFPLWKVVRASTAAPSYFEPEPITIAREPGKKTVTGEFVDGGISPHNNPALQAFMYATLRGYGVGWPAGADQLLVVSVGTGTGDPSIAHSNIAVAGAISAALGLMDDCAALVETLMQWMSQSPTARTIDAELGDLAGDRLGAAPLFTYQRYNVSLLPASVRRLKPGISDQMLETLPRMDEPKNLGTLRELGDIAASEQIQPGHFPACFDLR